MIKRNVFNCLDLLQLETGQLRVFLPGDILNRIRKNNYDNLSPQLKRDRPLAHQFVGPPELPPRPAGVCALCGQSASHGQGDLTWEDDQKLRPVSVQKCLAQGLAQVPGTQKGPLSKVDSLSGIATKTTLAPMYGLDGFGTFKLLFQSL